MVSKTCVVFDTYRILIEKTIGSIKKQIFKQKNIYLIQLLSYNLVNVKAKVVQNIVAVEYQDYSKASNLVQHELF